MTKIRGFSVKVRAMIVERENGLCALHHAHIGEQIHHRRPRGQGSSRRAATNSVANGLLVCAACHDWIERNRASALAAGWLVQQDAEPTDVPVRYRGVLVMLDNDGGLDYLEDSRGQW